ncbi:helix-turn-helix domain-containing protein [Natrarchaeobaculum aegyptiacum]|uniref:Bacterio-opsin activator n=1 Tax=Natrarchaeobaculum aegyptiacum TaxID=745377 RepID=A0A2Z2HV78_9EURY|nr:helix-turn-helix domain-containing protein [Natrarchaeobaculum aegyptiacum]ARS91206.1 bacterio-opsin activator [Natrarchaeobaculum aegyptiacum]
MISTRIYVEHPDLALTETIRSLSDAEISVVSEVGTDPNRSVYFFRIEAPEFDTVDAALEADHTVADFSVVLEMASQRTYRIEYSEDAKLITPTITDRGGLTLETTSYLNGWMLQLQLEGHEDLYELDERAREDGVHLEVLELTQNGTLDDQLDFGLTPSQTETLTAAYRHGYFDEPRESSVEELAELFDLSTTAVSGRLRRGSANLIEEFLLDDDNVDGG